MNTPGTQQEINRRIFLKVITRFGLAIIFIILLIFIPAGITHTLKGWLFVGGTLIPMMFALTWLMRNDPELPEKRVNMKEREKEQKKYVKISILLFVVTYIIPGLDFRYRWYSGRTMH